MGRQVVHDDDVAGPQGRHQHLLDVGLEADPVHRPVQDHRRGHAIDTQRRGERRGLPVAMRDGRAAALATQGAAPYPCHLGRGAGLIDEDQAVRIKVRLAVGPGAAPLGDVGSLLLGCVRGFF